MFDFLGSIGSAIMTPLYYAVSGILLVWHELFTRIGLDPAGGWSWALAIVGLTVTIRALLIPLFVKQIKSSRNMQLLQPHIKELQKKYGHDRERLAQEQMKLWKEHNTNPFASCLPLLLQMPVFFALFRVIDQAAKNGADGARGFMTAKLAEELQDAVLMFERMYHGDMEDQGPESSPSPSLAEPPSAQMPDLADLQAVDTVVFPIGTHRQRSGSDVSQLCTPKRPSSAALSTQQIVDAVFQRAQHLSAPKLAGRRDSLPGNLPNAGLIPASPSADDLAFGSVSPRLERTSRKKLLRSKSDSLELPPGSTKLEPRTLSNTLHAMDEYSAISYDEFVAIIDEVPLFGRYFRLDGNVREILWGEGEVGL